MRRWRIVYCLPLLLLGCMACTTLSVHNERWIATEMRGLVRSSEWRLAEVAVHSLDHTEQVEANATAIYRQLIAQRTQAMAREAAAADSVLHLQVAMRETTIERDFKRMRTIVVASQLSGDDGRVVGRGLSIVEAREGLVSARLLYRMVRLSLEVLR